MLNSLVHVAEKEEEEHLRTNCVHLEGSVLPGMFVKLFSQSSEELKRFGVVTGLVPESKEDECGATL